MILAYTCVFQDVVGYEAKNWRGLFIALLVIAAMCGVIGLAIFVVTPGKISFTFTFDSAPLTSPLLILMFSSSVFIITMSMPQAGV